MKDEEFVFVSDVREKKRIASGAFHKRTHAGKGGAVRFPSDYMSKKELNAMNGEMKSYNLNDPMTWKDFKLLPDDIKALYIKILREKFHVNDCMIFKMLGVSQQYGSKVFCELGISAGKKGGRHTPDKEAWIKWTHGIPEGSTEDLDAVTVNQQALTISRADQRCDAIVPVSGTMTFVGDIRSVMGVMEALLGDVGTKITVAWNPVESE